jgi:O-antigen/teichoic acid export membrane protein
MGIVAKEAGRSSIALVLGLAAGTVNTVLVLPRAFEGAEAFWGLLRVLTAWSYIVAPAVMFGGGGILLRTSNQVEDRLRGALHTSVWLLAFLGLSIWGLVLWFRGDWLMLKMDADKGSLLLDYLPLFFLMNGLVMAMNLSTAFLVLGLRTAWNAWVQEVWLKTSYLFLAALLLFDVISLTTMLYAYVGTWIVALLAMLSGVMKAKFPFSIRGFRDLDWKENLRFGAYSSLTGGVSIVATNLDFVMVGAILGLGSVPVYTMGYFVGSVVQLPHRAMTQIFSGIISKRIASESARDLEPFVQQATRVTLLLALTVFIGVSAGLRPLISALPAAYVGIAGVALAIGLQKIFLALSMISGQVLAHTPHYRLGLPLNVGLLITTVITNWFLMSYLEMGVLGAALATLFTAIWNGTWRLAISYRKVGIRPLTASMGLMSLVAAALFTAVQFLPFGWSGGHGYIEATVNGGFGACTMLGTVYALGWFPELRTALQKYVFSRFN